jgi:hypothetical protein
MPENESARRPIRLWRQYKGSPWDPFSPTSGDDPFGKTESEDDISGVGVSNNATSQAAKDRSSGCRKDSVAISWPVLCKYSVALAKP